VVESPFLEVLKKMSRYCTKRHGLVGKYWWQVDSWTGCPWSSFQTPVIL